jgi:membrane associated rhomboid family serine protease
VIPLKDRNPTSRTAVVTFVLIAVNIGVYLLVQQGRSDADSLRFTFEYAAIPCEVVEGEPLNVVEVERTLRGDAEACGAGDGPEVPEQFPGKREWLAVLTSMFLHGGLLHLAGNMLYLWIFGNNIEDRLGPVAYLGFYVAGGVVATLAHVLVNADSTVPVVGASGAIAAVMGAYLAWYPNAPIRTLIAAFFIFFTEIRAKWLLGFWLALQFFTSDNSGVAWVAHVGGFVFGVLFGYLIGPGRGRGRRGRERPRPGWDPPEDRLRW